MQMRWNKKVQKPPDSDSEVPNVENKMWFMLVEENWFFLAML